MEDTPRRWAQLLNEVAPRARVVAPPGISAWVPTFHDHAYPLSVGHYLRAQRHRIGEDAYRDRILMTRFASGEAHQPAAAAIFEEGLERYAVKAVCLALSDDTAVARQILRRAGFERYLQGTDMEIWVRSADR